MTLDNVLRSASKHQTTRQFQSLDNHISALAFVDTVFDSILYCVLSIKDDLCRFIIKFSKIATQYTKACTIMVSRLMDLI